MQVGLPAAMDTHCRRPSRVTGRAGPQQLACLRFPRSRRLQPRATAPALSSPQLTTLQAGRALKAQTWACQHPQHLPALFKSWLLKPHLLPSTSHLPAGPGVLPTGRQPCASIVTKNVGGHRKLRTIPLSQRGRTHAPLPPSSAGRKGGSDLLRRHAARGEGATGEPRKVRPERAPSEPAAADGDAGLL